MEPKREVKTTSFSPPGVGGVLLESPLAAQQACPARQVCGLTRELLVQCVRRLTTKELVFERFVAPRNAGVNRKEIRPLKNLVLYGEQLIGEALSL